MNLRYLSLLVLTVLLAACGTTAPAPNPNPPAQDPEPLPPPTVCDDLSETVESLEVPADTPCDLFGVSVTGDVTLAEGAELTAISVQVGGSVRGEGVANAALESSSVAGDVLLSGGGSVSLVDSTVEGSVRLLGHSGAVGATETIIATETIFGGDLEVSQNTGGVTLEGNIVSGGLVCEQNDPAPTGIDNQVSGDKIGQCSAL